MSKALFLLLLGLCAGGLGGYFLGLDTGRRVEAGRPARARLSTDEHRPEERSDSERAPDARSGERGSLREALDAIEVPAWSPGRGTITGVIRTDDGKPVSEALVRAEPIARSRLPMMRSSFNEILERRSLEERVKESVRLIKRREAGRVEVHTGEDGAYVLLGIGDERYWVSATRPGYKVTAPRARKSQEATAGSVVDFQANPAVEVPVGVYRADGSVPDRVTIIAFGRRGEEQWSTFETWTPKKSSIILVPGIYKLSLALSGEWPQIEATFVAGEDADGLIFREPLMPGIKGQVIIPEGEMARQLSVYHMRFTDQAPDTRALLRGGKKTPVWGMTGITSFTISPLKPGRYLVGITRNSGRIKASAMVDVDEGISALELVLPAAEARDCVVVHVFDPNGKPLEGVTLSVQRSVGRSDLRSRGVVVKEEHGVYWVLHHAVPGETDPPPAARWFVGARSLEHGLKEVEYRRGPSSEATIRFEANGKLTAYLQGDENGAFEGRIKLTLEAPRNDGLGWTTAGLPAGKQDQSGQVEFGPLSPGSYRLLLGLQTGRGETGALSATPVAVVSGPNRVTVRIPKLHRLAVLIRGSKAGTPCTLTGVDPGMGLRLREAVGEEGLVSFDMLPAGTYVVSPGQSGTKAMEIAVPAPGVVTYKARPVNAVRVWIQDPSGALASAGLRDGDVIVGLDGVDFDGQLSAMTAFMKAHKKSEVTLRVLRGATLLQLGVDPRILMSPDSGGTLNPARR